MTHPTGPFGYLICDPAHDETSCVVSHDPMTDLERRDGCIEFPLHMSQTDADRFAAIFITPKREDQA